MKKKINIRDHFNDDNAIDLSLSDLDEVPVKEIASIPKATILDLTNNRLISLPKNFSVSLSHLSKLDLSQNKIKELPENFGLLVHLKYLDLYQNQLENLPLSFSNLKSLKWLDLKDNSLVPSLAKVVGHCQDNAACQWAAKHAVKYMSELNAIAEEEYRIKQEQKKKNEKEQQQFIQKKENKKKKKKKNNAKNTEPIKQLPLNGQPLESEAVEFISEDKYPEEKKSYFNILKMGGSIIRTVFNLILISTLIFGLGLFVLSLVDENLYNKTTLVLGKNFTTLKLKLPKNYREYIYSANAFLFSSFKSISAMFYKTIFDFGQFVIESYNFLMTDETVQIYLGIFKENIHIGYIKTLDKCSVIYSKFVEYLSIKT